MASATTGFMQTQPITDVTQIFDLLESNKPEVVQDVKDLIFENLNITKDNWLIHGLYEYFVQSGSVRCSDILCGISREPHDKYLIERMIDGIRSPVKDARRQALVLLGQAVCKQPSWLYKITHLSLFRDLIKLLKTETDVVILLTGLLSLIMMLPIIPMSIVTYHQDFFDVFGRLATWTNTTHNIPKEHVLHLQVALYSLFHRLYAMFPCNFLSYLRHSFGTPDKRTVFLHTIMPMLEKVKMHPNLVTATRDAELNISRWQSRDYHDIIAECSKISLDGYESSLPEEIPSGFTNMGPNSCLEDKFSTTQTLGSELNLEDVLKIRTSTFISQAMDIPDMHSLAQFIEEFPGTAPPTPLSISSSSGLPYSHTGLTIKTNLPAETAMEATPENTPVKDRDRSHFKLSLHNTPAAIQLFGPKEELVVRHDRPVPQTPPATPFNSVPSSPLPVTSNLTRRDSIFDTTHFRREPLMFQRLQKIQVEQQAAQAQLQHNGEHVTSTPHQQASQPVEIARKIAVVAPNTAASTEASSTGNSEVRDADKHVVTGGPLTPVPSNAPSTGQQCFIDPDLSLITLDEEPTGDQCSTTTCPSGGLHMADHKSMVAFANRVKRLRYHSYCISGSDYNTSLGPSPGTSPSSTSSGAISARSRYMKRSMSCPDIKKPVIDDKDINTQKSSKLPEVLEVSGGQDDDIEKVDAAEATNTTAPEPREPEHPYEHLFQKILPGVLSPLDSRTLPSPYRLLDLCLVKAADLQSTSTRVDEITILKRHVELLHGQLLFERHRREAHALRNRRLAGKCRKMVTLEEQNNTMAQKIHNLEKEIASLRKEVTIQRNMGLARERELLNTLEGLESNLKAYKKDVSDLNREKTQVDSKWIRLSEEFMALHKESDQKKADYVSMENEVKICQKYIEKNKELKTAYETRLKEILLLGELLRKYKEVMAHPSENRYLLEQLEDYRHTAEEENRGLRSMLESVKSQQEAANGTISDLMKRLEKREAIIELQRKDMQEKEQEHHLQFQGLESKYESIKCSNQRLELEILSLQHQLSIKNSRPMRGRIASASSPSNNGDISPAGNSNHSDVDSAASAGGFQMSPERNMCIFGSPQFDNPPEEMKDLQAVLDKEPTAGISIFSNNRRRNSSPLTQTRDYRP